jgi:uncharacterized tellurite resistance protein B-like protein
MVGAFYYTKNRFLELFSIAQAHVPMNSYEEKLSILSEMIAFARVDEQMKQSEYLFLKGVARLLKVDDPTFNHLLRNKAEPKKLKNQAERLVQFHRLLLLMNVDQEQHRLEIHELHNIGLRMGLPPSAIDQVLEVMHQYPDNAIPPDVLIQIFKAHYN